MVVQSRNTALSKGAAGAAGVSRSAFGNSSGGYGAITHALRHSDIWAAAAGQSGDMGFELCYLPDMPAVLRTLAGAQNSIEKWWQQLEAARKYPEGSFKVINALAMAVSYDSDPTQFLGIRLSVTFDTCEVIEERWANWWRQDPVVAIETQADNLRRLKALYIDCGKKDQFNLLYGARRFVRRPNELGIAHRCEEFPDNHTGVDYRMDESYRFSLRRCPGKPSTFSRSPPIGVLVKREDVDTSCWIIFRPAFSLLRAWLMPKVVAPICDRIFLNKTAHERFRRFATDNRTVAFRTKYAGHYKAAGVPVPPGARSSYLTEDILKYLCSIDGVIEVTNCLGFYPPLFRWTMSVRTGGADH
jgi:hypothetical protein